MLPQGPEPDAGGNLAEAGTAAAPQGTPVVATSGGTSVGPCALGLLAAAALTLALLA